MEDEGESGMRLTGCLHGTIVRPTGRPDQSDRPVGPTIVPCNNNNNSNNHIFIAPYASYRGPVREMNGEECRATGKKSKQRERSERIEKERGVPTA